MTVATNTSAASLFSASNTVTGVPIGAAFAGRVVALFISTDNASSVTIGGVSATVTNLTSGIFSAAAVVPTGTTATVVTGGSATFTEILGAWSITGDPGLTPTFTLMGIPADPAGDPVDVLAGSSTLGLIFCAITTDTPSFTTGISNNGAAYLTNSGSQKVRDGSADNATTTTVTVTATGFTLFSTFLFAAVYAGTATPTTDIGWFAPLSAPPIKRGAPASHQQSFAINTATPITPVPSFGWFSPLTNPVRLKQGLAASQQRPFTAGTQPIIPPTPWFAPLSTPVWAKSGLRPAQQQTLAFNPQPFVAFSLAWHLPWQDPVRAKRSLAVAAQQFISFDPFPRTPSFGWYETLSEPVRSKIFQVSLQQAFAFGTLRPITPTVDGWWRSLTEPVRVPPALRAANQLAFVYGPVPIVAAISDTSWWRPLSEPVRVKAALLAANHPFAVLGAVPIATPTIPLWFANLSEPVRIKLGLRSSLQQFLAAPVRLLPTPNITGTMSALETKDTFLAGAMRFNRASSAEIGVVDTGAPGTEVGIITGNTSGTVATVSVSIRIV